MTTKKLKVLPWVIVVLVLLAMILNYIDRSVVGILKSEIQEAFSIGSEGFGRLHFVFTICYAASYVLVGWLVDRFGAGRMILISIMLWSLVCVAGAFAQDFHVFGELVRGVYVFGFLRGLLGIVEPVIFPGQLRIVTAWFPPSMRATANSVCACGGTLGMVVAPFIVGQLAIHYDWLKPVVHSGWQAALLVPGALGIVIGFIWWAVYRDPPREIIEANRIEEMAKEGVEEKVEAPAFKWGQLWTRRSFWGIMLGRFICDPVWFFCLFWLPGYLRDHSGLTLEQYRWVGGIPYLVAALGGILTSSLSDMAVRRGMAPLKARKWLLVGVTLLAPLCAVAPWMSGPVPTIVIFSFIGTLCISWLFSIGVVVAETFPSANVGSVWGISGAFGAGGGALLHIFAGGLFDSVGFAAVFVTMAFLHPVATVIVWLMVKKERPVEVPAA